MQHTREVIPLSWNEKSSTSLLSINCRDRTGFLFFLNGHCGWHWIDGVDRDTSTGFATAAIIWIWKRRRRLTAPMKAVTSSNLHTNIFLCFVFFLMFFLSVGLRYARWNHHAPAAFHESIWVKQEINKKGICLIKTKWLHIWDNWFLHLDECTLG